jgi:hypothetical protein
MFNTLSISSPQEFYKMLFDDDEINKHPKFSNFLDAMSDYYYGCECEHDRLFEVSKFNYNKLSKDDEIINIIKSHYNCEYVVFSFS